MLSEKDIAAIRERAMEGVMLMGVGSMTQAVIDRRALLSYIEQQDKRITKIEEERDANLWGIVELNNMIAMLKEERDELREDFVDYACSGATNLAPYCGNSKVNCVDGRGWCLNEACVGFQPKAYRGPVADGEG